jgi:phage tail sheath gpL-like
MTDITSNSFAAISAAQANNQPATTAAQVLDRKMWIVGTYDPTILTGVTPDVPKQVFSADQVAAETGRGFPLHRLAMRVFAAWPGATLYMTPQDEDGAAVQASGTMTVVGTATAAGKMYVYIDDTELFVDVALGDTETDVATAIAAAVTADEDLPVTASFALGVVTFEAKAGGTNGNDIAIGINLLGASNGQELPPGIASAVIVDMASGATDPDLDDALNGTGTGDLANSDFFTGVCIGYGREVASVLNKFSVYTGEGNTTNGLWSPTVVRPWRALWGDVSPGSAALTAVLALANGRKNDRSQGQICAPGSAGNPYELAAYTMAAMERRAQNRAEEGPLGIALPFLPGDKSDMWTTEYANRNTAVKAGVSTTLLKSGTLVVQDVLTFYHPDSVALANNGYRSQRNISILQNILNSLRFEFDQEKWQGVSIVADVSKVSSTVDREKARDTGSVRTTLFSLSDSWAGFAWIFTETFTKEKLGETGAIVLRGAGNGFDVTLSLILSGEGTIYNNIVKFDTSFAAVL